MKIKRIAILLNLVLSCSMAAYAQAPHVQWQKTIGGSNDDELYALEQTTDGGYILGGSSNSGYSGDKTSNTCSGTFDFWIVKIDCEGNIQWQKDIGGGNGDDVVNSIKQTRDGGYIVGGYAATGSASCQKTSSGNGIDDWWAMKLDSAGNIQWQIDLGGGCNDYLNSVEQTADGGYILGGDSRSNIGGDKTVNMCGNAACQVLSDYWVVKLDSTGVVQWQQDYGASANTGGYPGDDNLNAIHQTRDKGYILGGSSNGGISCTKNNISYNNSYDYWILKIDSVGNVQWQQQIGGDNLDALNDIHQTADGGYIAGGTSSSNISGNKTSNVWNNSSDYYVVKLDSTGAIQWQKDIGGDNYDGLNSIEQTTDHGYILGGFSNSDSSGNKTSNPLGGYGSGQYDYWVVKIDSIGDLQWQLDIGRNDTQAVLFGIEQTTDEGYILGGVSNPSSVNLSGKVNNVGNPYGEQFGGAGTHYWVVKLGNCSAGFCNAPPQQSDSVCLGNSITLTGIIEYGGFSWVAVPGGSPTSSLSCTACIDPVATPMQTTQYVEVSEVNPNLYCSDTATVVVVAPNSVRIDTNICFAGSVQLNVPANDSFIHTITWSPALYLNNDSIQNPVCTPLADTDITYIVTITNNSANHCGSIDTVSVTHLKNITLPGSDTAVCQGTPLQIPLTGNAAYTYTWSLDKWLNSNAIQTPIATPDSTVTYKVVASYLGCRDSLSYLVNVVYPPYVSNITTVDATACGICDGSITLHGLYPGQLFNIGYTFDGISQLVPLTSDSDGTVTITHLCQGTYDSISVRASICTFVVDSPIILSAPPLLPSFTYAVHYGCNGDTVVFTNASQYTGSVNYRWDFGDNTFDTATSPTHIYAAQDTFYATLFIGNTFCIDSVTDTIMLIHPLKAGFTISGDTSCQGQPVTFTNTSTGNNLSGLWSFGDGATDATTNPVHIYSNTGQYHVLLTETNTIPCQDTASAFVQIDSISGINLSLNDTDICAGRSITFTGTYSGIGNTDITWDFGDGYTVKDVNPIQHSYETAGVYMITLTADYRVCPDTSITSKVSVYSYPAVNIGPDTTMCPGQPPLLIYNLAAYDASCAYLWSTGDTVNGITVSKPGTYWLQAVLAHGCGVADSMEVKPDCYIGIPNAFSPNGDGVNDYFFPRELLSAGVTAFHMQVYNRWGEGLFETTNINGRGWDGKLNNEVQPEGVYIYLIDVSFANGTTAKYQGNVTLIR